MRPCQAHPRRLREPANPGARARRAAARLALLVLAEAMGVRAQEGAAWAQRCPDLREGGVEVRARQAAYGNYMLCGWSASRLTNSRPTATAAIWAAMLRAINALNTALQIDNQRWPPEQAPRCAASYPRRMVQLDYYDTTRTPDNDKVAAFARRWAGLVLTRRNDYVLKFD